MNTFVVTMYRWANREAHSYVLGVWDNKETAIEEAKKEVGYRGGSKYYPEILQIPINCGRNPDGDFPCHTVMPLGGDFDEIFETIKIKISQWISNLMMDFLNSLDRMAEKDD